jgi:hypothetical protein
MGNPHGLEKRGGASAEASIGLEFNSSGNGDTGRATIFIDALRRGIKEGIAVQGTEYGNEWKNF